MNEVDQSASVRLIATCDVITSTEQFPMEQLAVDQRRKLVNACKEVTAADPKLIAALDARRVLVAAKALDILSELDFLPGIPQKEIEKYATVLKHEKDTKGRRLVFCTHYHFVNLTNQDAFNRTWGHQRSLNGLLYTLWTQWDGKGKKYFLHEQHSAQTITQQLKNNYRTYSNAFLRFQSQDNVSAFRDATGALAAGSDPYDLQTALLGTAPMAHAMASNIDAADQLLRGSPENLDVHFISAYHNAEDQFAAYLDDCVRNGIIPPREFLQEMFPYIKEKMAEFYKKKHELVQSECKRLVLGDVAFTVYGGDHTTRTIGGVSPLIEYLQDFDLTILEPHLMPKNVRPVLVDSSEVIQAWVGQQIRAKQKA